MKAIKLFIIALIPSLLSAGHIKDWEIDFQEPASTIMAQLYDFHVFLMVIMTVIVIFVSGLLIYVAIRFNRSSNPVPAKFTHNVTIEVIWTIAPILILVLIAIPSFKLLYLAEDPPETPEMTLKIIGHQWYWEYQYPDHGDIQFESYMIAEKDLKPGDYRLLSVDNVVVLPVGTTIRLQTTSADVIHSWAVPAFGIKKDTVPGRVNESWVKITREGTYYGQCSELCGVDHGFMPIMVKAVPKEEFMQWVEQAKKRFTYSDSSESLDFVNLNKI